MHAYAVKGSVCMRMQSKGAYASVAYACVANACLVYACVVCYMTADKRVSVTNIHIHGRLSNVCSCSSYVSSQALSSVSPLTSLAMNSNTPLTEAYRPLNSKPGLGSMSTTNMSTSTRHISTSTISRDTSTLRETLRESVAGRERE
jgi:hypothetical protein